MVAVCLVVLVQTAAAAQDCTKVFVSVGADTEVSWHEDKRWEPPGVPGPTDVACILDSGNYQVTVSEPVTVSGLHFDATGGNPQVKILSTDFTLNGPGFLGGTTKLKVNDKGVLRTETGSTIEVVSKLVIDSGIVEVDVDLYGHLNYAGTGHLTGTLSTHFGSTIEYEDTGADAHLVVAEGFDNFGSVIFIGTVAMTLEVSSGILVNTAGGVISAASAGRGEATTPELDAEVLNHGVIDIDGLGLLLKGDGAQHQNGADGIIQVTDAELEISLGGAAEVPPNFTNYGTVTVAGGGSIRIVGSAGVVEVPSNFTNYGSVTVAGGGSIRVVGGAKENAGLAFVNWGFLDLESGGVMSLDNTVFDNPSPGTLRGSGILDLTEVASASFDGTLSPGFSPGILTIDGSLDLGTNTRVPIEVGGDAPGALHDRLDLTGALGAGGELDVVLIDPYHPVGGERFEILTFDSLGGWFNTTSLPPLMHHLSWYVDIGEHEVGLDVICEGTQLGIEFAADRDPVSVDHELIYLTRAKNHSQVAATDVIISSLLPPDLVYRPDLSSPECVLIGSTVECTAASLAPAAVWDLLIGVEPVIVGPLETSGSVAAWECDTVPDDDHAIAFIEVVAAEPCDANDDLVIDADDLVPAVGHIFGLRAAGNPDCRLANGVTADDLAAIIEAGH